MMDFRSPFSLAPLCLFLFFLFSIMKWFIAKKRAQKLPPGPWKLPIIGSLHHLTGSLSHHTMRDLAKKYGPLMHLQLGEISAIVVSSAHMAEEVMKTNDIAFADRPSYLITKIMLYDKKDFIFAPYGDHWRQMRKICTAELLGKTTVASFCSIREQEVSKLIASIRSSSGSTINLSEKVISVMSAIVARAAFGKKLRGAEELMPLLLEGLSLTEGFALVDLFPSIRLLDAISWMRRKLEKMHLKTDEKFDKLVNERRNSWRSTKTPITGDTDEEDLLGVLLKLQQIDTGLQFPITDTHIKAVILEMFGGATETSATTVVWAMSELLRNPRVMEKAQAEVRKCFKGIEKIRETDTQGLSYLQMVIKETLRLHPPIPFLVPRQCRIPCEINGYKIQTGTQVLVNVYAIGRDTEYWHDADSFLPERFHSSVINYDGTNFHFIPFGAGRRMCPGISFSLRAIELALAGLLFHFNWKLPHWMKLEDLDMTDTIGLVARKRRSLYLVATSVDPSLMEG